ncbi:hypothetical protein C9I57_26560 [Trinickia symbiotica]|uniref:Uncharacterized protein n=1 Tax=Trinickia symbiotica TaxID=863227 RepID=A0A2T3XMN1_9BURK|nr:hypothetical protein [Trinickia symbiotica]PTB17782.1 hypothetical protein C9I57_26560 [Trinickia symbiotica]
MQYVKVILLYFVLPIFGFAAIVVSQVGVEHLDWALWLTGLIVVAILVVINTGPREDKDEEIPRSDSDWDGYYTMQQSERLHNQHHD